MNSLLTEPAVFFALQLLVCLTPVCSVSDTITHIIVTGIEGGANIHTLPPCSV